MTKMNRKWRKANALAHLKAIPADGLAEDYRHMVGLSHAATRLYGFEGEPNISNSRDTILRHLRDLREGAKPAPELAIVQRAGRMVSNEWAYSKAYAMVARDQRPDSQRQWRTTGRRKRYVPDTEKSVRIGGVRYIYGSGRDAVRAESKTITSLTGREFIARLRQCGDAERITLAHGATAWEANERLRWWLTQDPAHDAEWSSIYCHVTLPATYGHRTLGLPSDQGMASTRDLGYALPFVGATVAMEDVMILPDIRIRRGYGYAWIVLPDILAEGALPKLVTTNPKPWTVDHPKLVLTEWYFGVSRALHQPVVRFGFTQEQAAKRVRDGIRTRIEELL